MKHIYVLGGLVFTCLIIGGGYFAFQTVTLSSQLHAFEEKYQLQNILSDPWLYGKSRCRTSHNSVDYPPSKCPVVVYRISVSQSQEVKKTINSSYEVNYPHNPHLHEYQVPFDSHSNTDFNTWRIRMHHVNPDSVYPFYLVEITLSVQ